MVVVVVVVATEETEVAMEVAMAAEAAMVSLSVVAFPPPAMATEVVRFKRAFISNTTRIEPGRNQAPGAWRIARHSDLITYVSVH